MTNVFAIAYLLFLQALSCSGCTYLNTIFIVLIVEKVCNGVQGSTSRIVWRKHKVATVIDYLGNYNAKCP